MFMKKKILIINALLLLCFAFSSCGNKDSLKNSDSFEDSVESSVADGIYEIYYVNSDETGLATESYTPSNTSTYGIVRELTEKLAGTPKDVSMQKCIRNFSMVRSITINENEAVIDFTSDYYDVTGVSEVLRRAGIVKTICEVPDIDYVSFNVDGSSLIIDGTNPIGRMSSDTFIDNTGGETTYYQNVQVSLYYTDTKGEELFEARHNVEFDGTISLEQLVVSQLIDGPLDSDYLNPVIPSGTFIRKVSLKDGICHVDLSKDFLTPMENVSPAVTVYSIVNSLVEIKEVQKVQITVEGETVDKYLEKVPLSSPLERNLEIVKTDTAKNGGN